MAPSAFLQVYISHSALLPRLSRRFVCAFSDKLDVSVIAFRAQHRSFRIDGANCSRLTLLACVAADDRTSSPGARSCTGARAGKPPRRATRPLNVVCSASSDEALNNCSKQTLGNS